METVLLADMNSFFASVEQADQPELLGKPVIVCGDPAKRHGITLAASREAKKYGIKTAMPCWEALSLCPEAIVVRPRMARYVETSLVIVEIAKEFSPLVEPFSIDELFIDTQGTEKLFGSSVDVASLFRKTVYERIGVPCSVGIAPNKLLAKICCDVEAKKSLSGISKWSYEDIPVKLWPRPVKDLFGVGKRMEKNFKNMGITTIGTLAQYPVPILKKKFGILGEVYHLSANGIDNSQVTPHSHDDVKGIGHSITLPRDYYRWEEIQVVLREITEEVCCRARRKGKIGKTISLYVRGIDLISSVQRSKLLASYSNLSTDICPLVEWLFQQHWGSQPVRAITISLSNLMDDEALQLEVFADRVAERSLAYTIDNIRYRYGKTAIFKASSLSEGGVYHERSTLIGGHKA
ncbi:hypothetical protein BHU72_08480 [Desulfuribacillus stibiiarsenatis]|uniref:DNA polymerase IV n=1 Tax=Desulfuribacillus stibiiarsenatis TaxID=1390249 RepID=A0A1E5L318_9FIRM|nr:DNA polymerase IV [Desulfuribacillus stibiiarsenatis]OEH84535.1 hypothetical protein BHU72_08480 [Desulfuribacillus stibiiarsenatis]